MSEKLLLYGWSGEHDGCPLHGHATDQSKAPEGCTCERHLNAKKIEGEKAELEARIERALKRYDSTKGRNETAWRMTCDLEGVDPDRLLRGEK